VQEKQALIAERQRKLEDALASEESSAEEKARLMAEFRKERGTLERSMASDRVRQEQALKERLALRKRMKREKQRLAEEEERLAKVCVECSREVSPCSAGRSARF
jgi:hypothetical protein